MISFWFFFQQKDFKVVRVQIRFRSLTFNFEAFSFLQEKPSAIKI